MPEAPVIHATQIQKVLSRLGRSGRRASPLERDAHALLSALCAPDGAVEIADQAAWELLRSECEVQTFDGVDWLDTSQAGLGALMFDEFEEDIAHRVEQAMRYLGARGLLHMSSDNPKLVRLIGREA